MAQQVIEKKRLNHDVYRTIKLFGMGMLFIGPTLRTWYFILEKMVTGGGRAAAFKKVLFDQTLFAPVFIGAFFTISEVLGGKTLPDVKKRLQTSYIPALKMNYVIWPAVQTVTFNFVPLSYRVIFVNFIALFWNTYLAWAANTVPEVQEHLKQ